MLGKGILTTQQREPNYVDLLEQYLEDDSEVLASIFDMLKHRSFEKKKNVDTFSCLKSSSRMGGSPSRESKGIRNQISQVEQRWLNALPLILFWIWEGMNYLRFCWNPKHPLNSKNEPLDLYLEA